jgi:hypothetical protein
MGQIMNARNRLVVSGLAVGIVLAMSQAAVGAVMPNATFGFAPLGNTSFSGSYMGSATSLTFASLEFVNTVPPTFNGRPNDFVVAPNDVPSTMFDWVTISPLTIALPTISYGSPAVPVWVPNARTDYLVFGTATTPANRYHFDLTEWSATATSSTSNFLSVQCHGVFRDSAGFYSNAPASLSFSLTGQSGSASPKTSVL